MNVFSLDDRSARRLLGGARGWQLAPPALAGGIALTVVTLRWQGVDWPAQLYRVHLFRAYGWIAFDTGWYGGHSPIAYSVLFPPLAATLGTGAAAIACAAAAAWAFDGLVRSRYGRRARVGSLCFAAGTVAQVLIGQLSFLSGLALALLALLALRTGRPRIAFLLAVCCALASFVAAFFLLLAAVTWGVTAGGPRRRESLTLAAAAGAPILLLSLVYHQRGVMPYPGTSLAGVIVVCVGAWLILPRRETTLRVGAAVYVVVATSLFVLHTPVGANITRVATTVTLPVLVCVVSRARRALLVPLAVFVIAWQLSPAVGAIGVDGQDASTQRAYFAGLLSEIKHLEHSPTRVEIPFTHDHWEATWVARSLSLARGWERQLDIADNPIFYRDGPLSAADYHDWLDENGVEWVALPDVALDYSARAEAELLRDGTPYLTPVWHDTHWRLWRVKGSPGMITGPARLASVRADGFTIVARHAGSITVRIRSTPTWRISGPHAGCLESSDRPWTVVRASGPGTVRVESALLPTDASSC